MDARLIDAKAIQRQFWMKREEWRGNGLLPSMEALMWQAAGNIVDNAPTIDAIPVEWLQSLAKGNDLYTRGAAKWILLRWKRKERYEE